MNDNDQVSMPTAVFAEKYIEVHGHVPQPFGSAPGTWRFTNRDNGNVVVFHFTSYADAIRDLEPGNWEVTP